MKQNKNRRLLTLVAPFAISLSLCACGGSEVAGGGPSGTEAGNAITAQILLANAPAPYAKVKLVEHNSLDGSEGAYIATADSNGKVSIAIDSVAFGSYTMEATFDETALQLPVVVKDTNSIDLGKQTLQ